MIFFWKVFYKISLFREKVSKSILKANIYSSDVTIISDDCWGAQYYKHLGLEYSSPFVGLWIEPRCYLSFLENIESLLGKKLKFVNLAGCTYPVADLDGHKIHFLHYSDPEKALSAWNRRLKRIKDSRLFYKIDFGKPGYSAEDIIKWNKLSLPNSIALVPQNNLLSSRKTGIHNGVYINDWIINGSEMYDISLRSFSLTTWINNGVLKKSNLDRILDILIHNRSVKNYTYKKLLD